MAYVGGKEAVVQTPMGYSFFRSLHETTGDSAKPPERTLTGSSAFIFWRSVYFTKMLSVKNTMKIAYDWTATEVFGRDVAMHQAPMGSRLNIDLDRKQP